jgi:AICAR transformylase/IMP cyclohydrolase PurH
MANGNNGNQFRDDEIIILEQLRDGKMVKNIFLKISGRLRLAHEQNQQISITTEVVRYDESVAVVRAVTTTMKGSFSGIGMGSRVKDQRLEKGFAQQVSWEF